MTAAMVGGTTYISVTAEAQVTTAEEGSEQNTDEKEERALDKKVYLEPEMSILFVSQEDIITNSTDGDNDVDNPWKKQSDDTQL